jgi:hypothetical protein
MSTLVASAEGQFIKALPSFEGARIYGWHKAFGLIADDELENRHKIAQRKGALSRQQDWICQFKIEWMNGAAKLVPVEGCEIKSSQKGWSIHSRGRAWQLSMQSDAFNFDSLKANTKSDKTFNKLAPLAFLLFFVSIFVLTYRSESKNEVVVNDEIVEPITVIVKEQKTVTVAPAPSTNSFAVGKGMPKSAHRAVMQNLGFLGLVGRKDLKKAIGGAQIDMKASPGAGSGGNEGSGGEVLSGLGKGVRATTVGNSGVQGLGGVGTKGKGGGGGGYGDVDIASGEGRGVSSIGIANGQGIGIGGAGGEGVGGGVGANGGLDRHVIQATIAKYLSQVRACYEDRLRVNPGLEGTLTMDFEIGGLGRLNSSKVKSSSVGDPQVGSCVATRMMGWEFPKPRGGVNVKVIYPFSLRPVSR